MFDFIKQYFINPILLNQGYNFINSTVYALVFIGTIYLIFLLLRKIKISIDKRLALALLPYVIFGTIIRVLEDTGILKSYLLVTPMIYGEMILFILSVFLISVFLERKFGISYFKFLFLVGILLLSVPLVFLNFKNLYGMFLVLAFFVPWVVIFYFIRWKPENKLVSLVHIFDGTASFTAVRFFGYWEQYPIPRFLMASSSPISFLVVKIIAIVSILILIDKLSNDKEFNNYIKLIIGILGFAPGVRDFVRLAALS